MRKLILFFALVACLQANAQNMDGDWKGSLQAGAQKLTTILHIDETDKNVTMDVVEQGAEKIPMAVNWLGQDSINVTIPQLMLSYSGKLQDGEINGTFSQQMFSATLIFKKGDVTFNRPQEPKAPYPYTTKYVSLVNSKAGVTLSGTLTYPVDYKNDEKVPVVLMVTGSGPENRDEEVFHHKPFLVIADYLARKGIASLRYDDRGTALSTGDYNSATTYDFADDAQAAIDWLRKSGKFSSVGVLGHSEGGLVAYILGSKGSTDFIVSLAGPACKTDTMMMVQLNGIAHVQGAGTDIVNSVQQARDWLLKDGSPWMNTFIDIDAGAIVKTVKCPVMALGGEKDLNVPVSLNVPSLETNLPKNKHNVIRVYKNLNHLFQHAKTGNPAEIVNIEETISPEVLADIATWIGGL